MPLAAASAVGAYALQQNHKVPGANSQSELWDANEQAVIIGKNRAAAKKQQ